MTCGEAEPLLNARLDNELDMASSSSVDHHLSGCHACSAQFAALQNLHDEIAAAELAYTPARELEQKLADRFLRPEKKSRSSFWALAGAAACVAVSILVVSMLRTTSETDALGSEILDNHLRSLEPSHLVDVPSSDQHTVKPWFQGKTSFSPPVPDLTANDFILIGARLEVMHQQPTAAIVYKRRQHVISLYVSPSNVADARPRLRDLGGYHLLHWTQDNMSYWAVSDVDPAALREFAGLIRWAH
jgi:anti-sigma factor RsiW